MNFDFFLFLSDEIFSKGDLCDVMFANSRYDFFFDMISMLELIETGLSARYAKSSTSSSS